MRGAAKERRTAVRLYGYPSGHFHKEMGKNYTLRMNHDTIIIALTFLMICTGCARVNFPPSSPLVTFAVVDVGQGLSQIGVAQNTALVWDLGEITASEAWLRTYGQIGSPDVAAIVVSHIHFDHIGNFLNLPRSLPFSGRVITGPYADTASIRRNAGEWALDIFFTIAAQGDTVAGLPGVRVECVWPPRDVIAHPAATDDLMNGYSLCFLLQYGATAAMITSDIDTSAQRALSSTYGFRLKSDILVAPHHGSSKAVDEAFFGYVNPDLVVVSCGAGYGFNFPSTRLVDLLYQMKVEMKRTDQAGNVILNSNGYYWE